MALVIPNSIENDTPADAAEVNQNFLAIQTHVNTNLLDRDGSVALTNPLLLPGDPTQPNHAANKGYVDGRDALYLPLAGGTMSGAAVFSAGGTFNENLTLGAAADLLLPTATSRLSFGSRLGQHINLYGSIADGATASHGIGVAGGTTYFRTGSEGDFRFYHGGVHSDTAGAGTGGVSSVQIYPTALLLPDVQSSSARAAVHLTYVTDTFYTKTQADAQYVSVDGDTMLGTLVVGITGSSSYEIRCGGDILAEQAGARMRADGAIASRIEDPSGTSVQNLYLDRSGDTAADPQGIYVGFHRTASTAGVGVNIGTIRINAAANGVDYNTTSDYRLKDDLGPVVDAAERVMELQPKRIRWKSNGYEQDGFIAHEVADVVPDAVTGDKDAVTDTGDIDPQELSPMALIPLLTAALQNALERIATLEAA